MFTALGIYGQTANGHAGSEYCERYGTRCATGVIQRKRYDRVFTDDDEDDDDDDDDNTGRSRRTFLRSRRNRPPAASDSDSEREEKVLRTQSKSAASLTMPSSSSSTLQYSHRSDGKSSDNETNSDASNATSESDSDSGSDTETYSEVSGPAKSARLTRSASGGKPVVTNGHIDSNYNMGKGNKYRTRNQGRRTVHYQETDSDVDYNGRDIQVRRTLDRRRTEVGSRARLCHS